MTNEEIAHELAMIYIRQKNLGTDTDLVNEYIRSRQRIKEELDKQYGTDRDALPGQRC